MKTCLKCKQIKSHADFHKKSSSKDGLQKMCIQCTKDYKQSWYQVNKESEKARTIAKQRANPEFYNARVKAWQKANPDRVKDTILKRDFGISLEQYNQLLKTQDNSCAICKTNQSQQRIMMAVDHDHTSNKIRGLLCDLCNRGIGLLKDDPMLLDRASSYIRYNRG